MNPTGGFHVSPGVADHGVVHMLCTCDEYVRAVCSVYVSCVSVCVPCMRRMVVVSAIILLCGVDRGGQKILRLGERLELNEAITIENNPRDKSLGKTIRPHGEENNQLTSKNELVNLKHDST